MVFPSKIFRLVPFNQQRSEFQLYFAVMPFFLTFSMNDTISTKYTIKSTNRSSGKYTKLQDCNKHFGSNES